MDVNNIFKSFENLSDRRLDKECIICYSPYESKNLNELEIKNFRKKKNSLELINEKIREVIVSYEEIPDKNPNISTEINQLSDKLISELNSVSYEILEEAIVICNNGHIVCSSCYSAIMENGTCPMCCEKIFSEKISMFDLCIVYTRYFYGAKFFSRYGNSSIRQIDIVSEKINSSENKKYIDLLFGQKNEICKDIKTTLEIIRLKNFEKPREFIKDIFRERNAEIPYREGYNYNDKITNLMSLIMKGYKSIDFSEQEEINFQRDADGFSALHMACQFNSECVGELLKYGANIFAKSKKGEFPRRVALIHENMGAVRMLDEFFCRTYSRNIKKLCKIKDGKIVIDYMLDSMIVNISEEFLIENKSFIIKKYKSLIPNFIMNYVKTTKVDSKSPIKLFETIIDEIVNYRDCQYFSALHYSTERKLYNITKYLLKKTYDPNQFNDKYLTPFHLLSEIEDNYDRISLLKLYLTNPKIRIFSPTNKVYAKRFEVIIDDILDNCIEYY